MTTHRKLTLFSSQQWVHEVSSFHASRALPPSDAWPLGSQDLHLTLDVLGQKYKTTSYTREKHKWHRDFHHTMRLVTGGTIFDQVSKEGLSTAKCKLISCSIEACDFPDVRSTASTCVGRRKSQAKASHFRNMINERYVGGQWSKSWWLAIPQAPHEGVLPRMASLYAQPPTNQWPIWEHMMWYI